MDLIFLQKGKRTKWPFSPQQQQRACGSITWLVTMVFTPGKSFTGEYFKRTKLTFIRADHNISLIEFRFQASIHIIFIQRDRHPNLGNQHGAWSGRLPHPPPPPLHGVHHPRRGQGAASYLARGGGGGVRGGGGGMCGQRCDVWWRQ